MNNEYQIVMIDTDKVKPYHRNARKNDETVQKLVDIIPKVGFNQPIVIDKKNVIVKGHSRWKAAVRLGMKQVPCIISENDDETNKMDRLADNKIQEFSKWDEEILNTELASINIEDIDMSDFGFDMEEFNNMTKYEAQYPVYEPVTYSPDGEPAPQPTPQYSAYMPPKPDANYIKESDVQKTVPNQTPDYGSVTCPKCGQVVLYKK